MNEVTYSKARRPCPAPPQRRQEAQRLNVKDLSSYSHKGPSAPSSSWKVLAVVLGLLCLALLAVVGFLAYKFIQNSYSEKKHSCKKEGDKKVNQNSVNAGGRPGNISCNKESYETVWKNSVCPPNWYQHGGNCYFFSRMMLPWNKCPDNCASLNSSFVKVDTEEAMDFVIQLSKLQCEMRQEKFFLSLAYKNQRQKWVWLDGTDYTLNKLLPRPKNADNTCIYMTNGRLNTVGCQSEGYCVCKKNLF